MKFRIHVFSLIGCCQLRRIVVHRDISVSFLSSIWILRDDAASDCQRWHPLLLFRQWQASSLDPGRGKVVEVQFAAVAYPYYLFRSIVAQSERDQGGCFYPVEMQQTVAVRKTQWVWSDGIPAPGRGDDKC